MPAREWKTFSSMWFVLLLPVVSLVGCGLFGTGTMPPSAADADGDGVRDSADQCEDSASGAVVDATGCAAAQLDSDSDSDGVSDALDDCARTPVTVDVDDRGCPVSAPGTPDDDDDGVPNDIDGCANTAVGGDVDPNGCAESQLDTDGDNVTDDRDECPATPPQTVVLANGCPDAAPPPDPTPTGPAPVVLRTAGDFVILAKSGIDTVPDSVVTGDIGVSPIDSTAITGFSLVLDASTTFSASAQVTGMVFAADYTSPTPANMTTAISDMETAYTDAAGRPTPDFTELGAGDISGLTLVPGLYKWGTGVLISADVTLSGGPNDVWIFQIAEGITQASATSIILSGGALPKNVFWQVFGAVALDPAAHFEGIILSQTEITLATGASMNGRLLSQTAVTLDQSTVTQPAP